MVDHIEITKSGDKLTIGVKSGNYQQVTLKAEIAMPELVMLDLSGASRGRIEGFRDTEKIVLLGASTLDMLDIVVGELEIDLSGASKINGEGEANKLTCLVSGASKLEFSNFQVKDVNIDLSGASVSTLNLNGRLDADVSGASTLEYLGNPTLGNIETSGSSTIKKK